MLRRHRQIELTDLLAYGLQKLKIGSFYQKCLQSRFYKNQITSILGMPIGLFHSIMTRSVTTSASRPQARNFLGMYRYT